MSIRVQSEQCYSHVKGVEYTMLKGSKDYVMNTT